jgi:hypothetical protein
MEGVQMNDHIPDLTKMISDTPRTDEACSIYDLRKVAQDIERELNRACGMYRKLDIHTLDLVDRIMRLEEAGNNLLWNFCPEYTSDFTESQSDALKQWNKAKEVKP